MMLDDQAAEQQTSSDVVVLDESWDDERLVAHFDRILADGADVVAPPEVEDAERRKRRRAVAWMP